MATTSQTTDTTDSVRPGAAQALTDDATLAELMVETLYHPTQGAAAYLDAIGREPWIAAARAVRDAVLSGSVVIDRETAEMAREIATIARDQTARGAPGFGTVHHRVVMALTAALEDGGDGE